MLLNISSIPVPELAEVSLKTAPISFAYSLASASDTCSLSNKSLLLAANPITIMKKNEINYIIILLIFLGA